MNLSLWKSFFKDKISFLVTYFISNILIALFYSISIGKRIEILYPLAISFFVCLIYLAYSFYEYARIYHGLEEMLEYIDFEDNFRTELNKKTKETIKKIHMEYLSKLAISENNRKKERRFLSMWIHNMKTPITVTDLLIQRMEKGEISSDEGIEVMKEENKKLLSHLDMVLNIIRLEEFAKDYVPERIDLISEMKAIINKNKSLFIYNNVFPKIVTDLEEAIILSDKKWNELMIAQLISNAVKYSRDTHNPKTVYFTIERSDKETYLTIRDEGIGIPEHDLSKVCEPFFTGDNGRKDYRSSGIGLYFCKEVCRMLGHALKIESQVGTGTSVKISYLTKL